MDREIKFRAWDDGKMVYEKDIQHLSLIDEPVLRLAKFWCNVRNDSKVMQYIGLKDKNGKEIYEGDILCSDEYKTWAWRGVVKFSHGVFGVEWLANVKSQSMVGSWGQNHNLRKLDDDILERQIIIGNIYENPNLLTNEELTLNK